MPVESCPHSYTYIILLQNDYDTFPSTSSSVPLKCTFSWSYEIQFMLLCHIPPFMLLNYARSNICHWLIWQESGARSCNYTNIILSLNKIKISSATTVTYTHLGHKADNQLKKVQCLNGTQCQELPSSCVHFPFKLGNSGLHRQVSAFQEPCSIGNLSTNFFWTVSLEHILPWWS